MKNISQKIIFFGTEDFSAHFLSALIDAEYDIAAVVTKPDTPKGRGHKVIPPSVKVIANTHSIPVWQPAKLADITEDIKALSQVAGVLVSYGKIVPKSIIDLFSPGIINVHPSLLPKYRGPSPVESAILHGDTETGVSIMQLSAAMDAGPVYHEEPYTILPNTSKQALYHDLSTLGTNALLKSLPDILDGTLQPISQDDSQATYCQLIKKTDSVIDWHKPAEILEREIRAYKGWPGSRTLLGSTEVIITEAHVGPANTHELGYLEVVEDGNTKLLMIGTAKDYLVIDKIKPVGKKEMPIGAFLAGYRDKL